MKTLENHSIRDELRKITTVIVVFMIIILVPKLAYGDTNVSSNNGNVSFYNISLISEPAGASIFINGEFRGKTPKTFQLAMDSYHLEIINASYEPFSEDYVPTKDDIVNINLKRLYFTWDVMMYIISIGIIGFGFIYIYHRYKIKGYENNKSTYERDLETYQSKISESETKLRLYQTPEKELINSMKSYEKKNLELTSENNGLRNDNKELNNKLIFAEQQLESEKSKIKQIKNRVDYLDEEKTKIEKKLIETNSSLSQYNELFDLKSLPGEQQRSVDLERMYDEFIEEKRVLREVYAIDEVLTPILYSMKNIYTNTDVKVIRNYPVYSPKQVFKLLQDIELKLEKNPEFMQCLKAIKRRL